MQTVKTLSQTLLSNISASQECTDCEFCGQPIKPILVDVARDIWIQPKYHANQSDNCPAGLAAEAREMRDGVAQEITTEHLLRPLGKGRYNDFRFATWDESKNPGAGRIKSDVLNYANYVIDGTTSRWLYLWGSYGLGKTHLAVAATRFIATKMLARPMVVLWPEHCSNVKQSWDDDGPHQSESQLWARMKRADILLLDDIDKLPSTRWALQKLFEIVNYRALQQKPVIITANHSMSGLLKLWTASRDPHVQDIGKASHSRIAGEIFTLVEFVGRDQRRI